MGRKPLRYDDIAKRAAAVIRDHADREGIVAARIAERSGLSESTISRILTQKRTMTLPELDRISAAVGLVGWQVMKEASE